MLREQEKRENLPDRVGVLFVCVHGSATNKATKSIITALQTKIEKENLLVTWVVSFDHDKKGFMNALAVEEHLQCLVRIVSLHSATTKSVAENDEEIIDTSVRNDWIKFKQNARANQAFSDERQLIFDEVESNGYRILYTNLHYSGSIASIYTIYGIIA